MVQDRLQAISQNHYRFKNILLINACNMEVMKHINNEEFDLAIIDAPYGIGKDGQKQSTGGNGGRKAHEFRGWDNKIPEPEYFTELFRVSKNQIIWGANYMTPYIPPSMGWIFWDKGQRINQSDGELAFTSFDCALRVYECNRVELLKDGTIHPCQKPIKLYKWLLANYAKKGDIILDTHGGSMSLAVACHELGFSFVGIEKDEKHYRDAVKRFDKIVRQIDIFSIIDNPIQIKPEQQRIL